MLNVNILCIVYVLCNDNDDNGNDDDDDEVISRRISEKVGASYQGEGVHRIRERGCIVSGRGGASYQGEGVHRIREMECIVGSWNIMYMAR